MVTARLDETQINSLRALFECDLNVSAAAKKLGVHRNTLVYRYKQCEAITGLNPLKFYDSVKLYEMLALKTL